MILCLGDERLDERVGADLLGLRDIGQALAGFELGAQLRLREAERLGCDREVLSGTSGTAATGTALGQLVVERLGDLVGLLLVATGNITNAELESLVKRNFARIKAAFAQHHFVELNREALVIHE